MSSTKVKAELSPKKKAQMLVGAKVDETVQQKLVVAYETYLEEGKKSTWKLADEIVDNSQERNIDRAIELLKDGIVKKYGIEWKEKSHDPAYVSFSRFCSKLRKVARHPKYSEYRNSGKSLYQCYAEIAKEESKLLGVDIDPEVKRREKRATKANNEWHEEQDRIAKLKEENKEKRARERNKDKIWSAYSDGWDLYEEWKGKTLDIIKDDNGKKAYVKVSGRIARQYPELFIRVLKYIIKIGYLPKEVKVTIE